MASNESPVSVSRMHLTERLNTVLLWKNGSRREKIRALLLTCFIRSIILFTRALPLTQSFPKGFTFNIILAIKFQHMNFERNILQTIELSSHKYKLR
jgi:hypothetical protein